MSDGEDVRDAIRAAFEADVGSQADPAPASAAEAPAAPPPAESAPVDTSPEKSGQPRDDHGRFASKPETTEPADSKPSTAKAGETAPAEPAVETPPAKDQTGKPPVAPPRQWSDGAKVKWQRLPREVQEELAKIDAQGQYGALHDVIEPRRAQFAIKGQTPQQAIDTLLTVWDALEKDPLGTLQWLGQQYRIDPAKLFPAPTTAQPGPAQEPAEPEYVDPAVKSLRDAFEARFRAQDERYQALQSQWLTSQQQAEAQRRTSISAEVQAFRSDPAHPHYDIVEPDMARLIQAGAATDINDAYDKAVWMNPTLRDEMLSQQRAEDQQRREREARERAEAARKAAGSVTGSPAPGASVSDATPHDLRSDLARQVYASERV